MKNNNEQIKKKIKAWSDKYIHMDFFGKSINCPYWINKIKNRRVVLRGFMNGKGDPNSIHAELKKLLKMERDKEKIISDSLQFNKFARRNRIGIDCSGLAFRLLDELVKQKYKNCILVKLSKFFPGGINRTNVDTMTNDKFAIKVSSISKCQLGDLIRMDNDKHVLVVIDNTKTDIRYIHSSSKTGQKGVHFGRIKILDLKKTLDHQDWQEKTKKGENYGESYFKTKQGDGIYRLKIFS